MRTTLEKNLQRLNVIKRKLKHDELVIIRSGRSFYEKTDNFNNCIGTDDFDISRV